jgi:hypothetical protein
LAKVSQLLGPLFCFAFVKRREHAVYFSEGKNMLMSGILSRKQISGLLLTSPPVQQNVPNAWFHFSAHGHK